MSSSASLAGFRSQYFTSNIIRYALGATATLIVLAFVFQSISPYMRPMAEFVLGTTFSDKQDIRAQLALLLIVISVPTYLLWRNLPQFAVRSSITIGLILFSMCFSIITLLIDKADFTAEDSKMTSATGCMLLLAGFTAYANYWMYRGEQAFGLSAKALWLFFCAVFTLAAFDELFMLHEFLGSVIGRILGSRNQQDAVTVLYALSALAISGLVAAFLNRANLPIGRNFVVLLLIAGLTYFVSVCLDTFDWLAEDLSPTMNSEYLFNCVEETLELIAAGLFLSAFLVSLLEAKGEALLHQVIDLIRTSTGGRKSTLGNYAAVGLLIALLGFAYVMPIAISELLASTDESALSEISDRNQYSGLNPDGLYWSHNKLYVANDDSSSVIAIDDKGKLTVIADHTQGLIRPDAITVAKDDTIYVSDDGANAVFKILKDGTVSKILDPSSGLKVPKGLAVGPSGELFIADTGASRILRYAGGRLVPVAENIEKPEELAIAGDGTLYYTHESPPTVYKISPGMAPTVFADKSSGLEVVESVAVWGDYIYVGDSRKGLVRFPQNGKGGAVILERTLTPRLEGIAINGKGAIFLGLRRGRTSKIYRLDGAI